MCIAVLTRGYTNIQKYNILIKRNISIATNLNGLNIDILIFHEGNILENHQQYIMKFTPNLNIKFICIKEHAFKDDKKNIQLYEPTKSFGLNYRHMCSFWFVDFWKFVENYDLLLRIDEDCIIDFNIPSFFQLLYNNYAVYGLWTKDQEYVTHGLNAFTKEFLIENMFIKQPIISHAASGPYTNVFGLHLKLLRENSLIGKYVEKVKESNYIYIFRWGDLPLWGEVLYYLCNPKMYIKSKNIKYFHGSHNIYIENSKSKLAETKNIGMNLM